MTPERWAKINELFHAALQREDAGRDAFIAENCAGDDLLRDEIAELLASHKHARDFIETPAADVAAELLCKSHPALVIGEHVGPYKMLELLGTGGMGEVYLATDTRLNRQVALKVLPAHFTISPERVHRFEQEARAASALNHPNIVTIHEILRLNGNSLIVTEFVHGRTLRAHMAGSRLSLGEIVDIAGQVAAALDAAHTAGIVHRDIKPENIMVREDGYVKILDFGLAKLIDLPAVNEAVEGSVLNTNPGLVMGTTSYMSPEQARGLSDVDARSDIWSLGVVLYEMLTGGTPFVGETSSHTIVSILEKEPPPLDLSSGPMAVKLAVIVSKTLRKTRAERYQTIKELAADLRDLNQELEVEARLGRIDPSEAFATKPLEETRLASRTQARTGSATSSTQYLDQKLRRYRPAALAALLLISLTAIVSYFYFAKRNNTTLADGGVIDSVAVLPSQNLDNDPNKEYLSEAISDSVINSLSQLSDLKVMSLNSVLRYKGKSIDVKQVNHDLGVKAVLMSRFTQHGADLSIITELIDARDNHRLWGNQYNRKLSEILNLQDEIARDVSDKLRLRLSEQDKQRMTKHYTENTQAYQLYNQGMHLCRTQTKEGFERSIDYFQQAISIDPNYAPAYAGLGRAAINLGFRSVWRPQESRQKAEVALLKALELDDTLADAHVLLGVAKQGFNWDWEGAEKEFKRALELEPNSTDANSLYCVFLVHDGRVDEALNYAKRIEELLNSSHTRPSGTDLEGYVYLHQRQFKLAIQSFLKSKPDNPKLDRGNFLLAEAYLGERMHQDAIDEMRKVIANDNSPERWDGHPILAYAYAMAGRRDDAVKILDEQKRLAQQRYISPYNFAIIYTGLGDRKSAFQQLEKAYDEGSPELHHLPSRPMFDSLHSDPRYADLVRRMNLDPKRF